MKTLLSCVWMKVHLLKEEGGVSTVEILAAHLWSGLGFVCRGEVFGAAGVRPEVFPNYPLAAEVTSAVTRKHFSSTQKQKNGVCSCCCVVSCRRRYSMCVIMKWSDRSRLRLVRFPPVNGIAQRTTTNRHSRIQVVVLNSRDRRGILPYDHISRTNKLSPCSFGTFDHETWL